MLQDQPKREEQPKQEQPKPEQPKPEVQLGQSIGAGMPTRTWPILSGCLHSHQWHQSAVPERWGHQDPPDARLAPVSRLPQQVCAAAGTDMSTACRACCMT